MRRIRVVLWVVLVMAMLAMSAGSAAAGSKPTSVLESSLSAQETQSGDVDRTFELASSGDRWL
jgi:hypothetical protein